MRLHLTLVTLKGQREGHSDFRWFISHKGAELGYMLLLDSTRKPCMGNAMTLSHLTLSVFERSTSRSFRFQSIISVKRAKLGHMLLLNIDRKLDIGSFLQLHLTLVILKG